MGIALAGVSLPIFFTGLVALAFFSYRLRITAPGGSFVPFTENPAQWAYSLLLPWITLAFLFSAQYARLTRAGMLETMSEDYIRTARAKGLPERAVVLKHALRGALTPVLTIFGLDVAAGRCGGSPRRPPHRAGKYALRGSSQRLAKDPRRPNCRFSVISPT
jgi:peptide/nickel transport system permease protein